MRTFLVGMMLGAGMTVGGAFAVDVRSPSPDQKVVNWGMLAQKAGEFSPTRFLR